MQMTGIFRNVLQKTQSKEGMNLGSQGVIKAEECKSLDEVKNDPELKRIVSKESETFFY